MGICKICKKESEFISSFLSLCKDCISNKPKKSLPIALKAHEKARKIFDLTPKIPKDKNGLQCLGCGNECKIPEGEKGYCGLVVNKKGKIVRLAGSPDKGLCTSYYDAHVTNCVASWACPAGTGCGFPKFAYNDSAELGYYNLAVFYGACNFDCLFCQNFEFKNMTKSLSPLVSAKELALNVHEKVSCICYFGGNPDPQLPHVIEASRIALELNKGRILRICMETNGNANPILLKKFADIAFKSGGSIKFDLKFFNEKLNLALTGLSNKITLKNFEMLTKYHKKRKEVPFLYASTLLVPSYVDAEEMKMISEFIANLDNSIPYSLLAFYPTFLMHDLPFTSEKFAKECLKIAKEAGLEKVRVGNVHLLR